MSSRRRQLNRRARELGPQLVGNLVLHWSAELRWLTLSGADVTAWRDARGANAANGTQGTAADRPSFEARGWSNGRPQVRFDAANTELVDLGTFAPSGNSYTCVAALDVRSVGGLVQCLLNAAEGGPISIISPDHAGQLAIFDGTAWRDVVAAVAGQQVLTWVLDAGATQVRVRRNGAQVGQGTYDGTWSWTAPRTIGGCVHGHCDVELAEIALYNRVLTLSEIELVERSLRYRFLQR